MPRAVTVTLAHDLGKDEAARRLRDGSHRLRGALSTPFLARFQESWTSPDQMTFDAHGLGQKATGVIDVFPQHVRIIVTLPNVLAAIAETIAGRMEKEGRLLLEGK